MNKEENMNNEQKSYIKELELKISHDNLKSKIKWANFYAFDYPEYANSDEITKRIISYYEKVVLNDDVFSCANLGVLYYSGVLIEQDFKKAVTLYAKASDLGSLQAMCNLGYCFYYGRDIEVNRQYLLSHLKTYLKCGMIYM